MYICTQQYAFEAVEKKGVGAGWSLCSEASESLVSSFSLFFNNSLSTEMYDSDERDVIQEDLTKV